jgi:TolA-binding protein
MRKIILFLCCVCCIQLAVAQRSAGFVSPDRLFYEGQATFKDENYAGTIDKILQFKNLYPNSDLIQEADFLLVASNFHQGRKDAGYELREYLDNYPQTFHRNEISFMLGSVYFQEGNYKMAEYWFKQSNIDLLSESQQEDYAHRMGIIKLQNNEDDEAFRLFSLLNQHSEKYRETAQFYLAYLEYKKGHYAQALTQFEQLRNNPKFRPEVLYYITQINFVQEKYNQAIREATELINAYPRNAYNTEMERIIGISYFYGSHYARAIEHLNRSTSSGNVDPKDFYILGLSYFNLQNFAKAAEAFNKSNPQNDVLGQDIYLHLGQSYLKLGDYNNALRAFESASRMNHNPVAKEAALYNYAMLLHQNSVSGFGESVTVLENFVNDYPNSIYADKVNDVLVDVYLTTKNYETALNSIAKIRNPGRKILEAKQKIYYHLGTIAFANANYNEAIKYFTSAIDAGNYAVNEREQAIYWRGESHYKRNEYANAIRDYQAFLNTKNTSGNLNAMANYNLGYSYFNQEQYSRAEGFFKTFVNRHQGDKAILADAYARLGDTYFHNRQFGEAEKAYNQAVSIMPSMSDYALFQKGYVMGLQKDYRGKINQMDRLIREFSNSIYITDAIYEKGRAFVLLNEHQSAIDIYNILLNQYPNSNLARRAGLQIGLLYYNTNQPQRAATAYKNVIAKYPGSEEAKVAIQDLKSVYFDMNDVAGYAEYVRSLGGAVRFEVSEQDSLTYLAAERFFLRGNIPEAQRALTNYLQSFPTGAFNVNAHYYLAHTYYDQKNFAQAKKEYAKVLEFGSTQFTEEAVGRTAELQFNDKEYEAALHSYERLQNTAATKTNQQTGSLGVIRSAAQLNRYNDIVNAANLLLRDESLNPQIATEAKFFRARAFFQLGEKTQAEADWRDLSKDTRTNYGAEAKYLLAQHLFNERRTAEAKTIVQDYIQKGTPHAYWLARSYILLSDIFAAENDNLQARQYLESLQTNYKNTNDDIHQLINERLNRLN